MVSVIIPAYRAAGTIGRAIDSLLTQTRPPDEIVVVDDGSPDDLSTALESYGDRVVLARKPNGGAASARNHGIELARGELLAFLDADDYWEPDKLERQLRVFADHSEVGLCAGRFFTQQPGQDTRTLWAAENERFYDRILTTSGSAVLDVMLEIWTTTVVVRREALGTNRFVSGLEPAEDRDLWIRLIASSPVYLTSAPLATWVFEPGSLSRTNIDRDCSNMMRVLQRHRSLLDHNGLRRWESYVFRRWAANHLGDGRPQAAFRPAWQRLCRQPTSLEAWWILLKCSTLSARASRSARLASHA